MTYKFVFDPRINAVLPLSVHPPLPQGRRRREHRLDLALVALAIVASVAVLAMMKKTATSPAASPVGASVTSR